MITNHENMFLQCEEHFKNLKIFFHYKETLVTYSEQRHDRYEKARLCVRVVFSMAFAAKKIVCFFYFFIFCLLKFLEKMFLQCFVCRTIQKHLKYSTTLWPHSLASIQNQRWRCCE